MKTSIPYRQKMIGFSHPRNRGGALITVLILGTAILLLVGSYLSSLVTQQRIAHRAMLHNEARNAAEGVAAVAIGEINLQVASRSNIFSGDVLSSFSLRTEDIDVLAPSGANVLPTSLEFQEGPFSLRPTNRVVLFSDDPVNIGDPDVGRFVSVRTKELFSKATVKDPTSGTDVTSRVAHFLRFTQGAWFDYAIFFNMDLEFHAGPPFTVGSTHSNGDIYAVGGDNLTFTDTLTTSGRIYKFLKYNRGEFQEDKGFYTPGGKTFPGRSTSSGHGGNVRATRFNPDGTRPLVNLTNATWDGSGSSNDSTRVSPSFAAANTWNGGVMDGTMNVAPFNPPGMQLYVPEDFRTATVELRNNGYVMIEPQLADTNYVDDYSLGNWSGYKGLEVENMKFSGKAGLTIQVRPPVVAGQQPQWKLVWYQPEDSSKPLSAGNPARRESNGLPMIAGELDPFLELDSEDRDASGIYPSVDAAGNAVDPKPTLQRALRLALLKAIVSVPYKDDGVGTYGTGGSTTTVDDFTPVAGPSNAIRVINANNARNDLDSFNDRLASANTPQDPRYYPIYDRREGSPDKNSFGSNDADGRGLRGAFHTLIIDMVALHRVLNDIDLWRTVDDEGEPQPGSYRFNPDTQFNGSIYVQFPLPATVVTARNNLPESDRIRVAVRPSATAPGYALLLRNGGGSTGANSGTGFLPRATRLPRGGWDPNPASPDGFTIATNGPAYIWGHYNANGISSAGNMTEADADWQTNHPEDPDTPGSPTYVGVEVPALIAADAVTILSANANYATGTINFARMTQRTANRNRASVFTELATAIIAGIVPTKPYHDAVVLEPAFDKLLWAGGVHNFIRYLEDWGGDVGGTRRSLGYRGSVVCLFENEVMLQPYVEDSHNYWYGAPGREIGYHPFFLDGRYPPGTPLVNSVRVISLRDITESEWTEGPKQPPPYGPVPP